MQKCQNNSSRSVFMKHADKIHSILLTIFNTSSSAFISSPKQFILLNIPKGEEKINQNESKSYMYIICMEYVNYEI